MDSRTRILIGSEKCKKLQNVSIAIIGLGGVGSFAVEALARAGIGKIVVMDSDKVCKSNLNRQIFALNSTIGEYKAEIAKARILDINPACEVHSYSKFYREGDIFCGQEIDIVLDCIDSFMPKLRLIQHLLLTRQKFISSMGAAGKTDTEKIQLSQMNNSYYCPMAKKLRKNLRRNNLHLEFPIVFSTEIPKPPLVENEIDENNNKRYKITQGSISIVPAIFGLKMAGWACHQIID